MTRETVRIVADERERQSGIPDELVNLKAVVDFKQLQVGDYIVASDSAVERKSIRDLVQSIYDGRLFTQCSELVTHYAKAVLIVEGSNEMFERVIDNPMVIYGALASVARLSNSGYTHTIGIAHRKGIDCNGKSSIEGEARPVIAKGEEEQPSKDTAAVHTRFFTRCWRQTCS